MWFKVGLENNNQISNRRRHVEWDVVVSEFIFGKVDTMYFLEQ